MAMHRLRTGSVVTLLGVLAAALPAQAGTAPAAARHASAPAGPAQFWFGTYPDFLVQFDPQKDEVARKIRLQNGMPFGVTLLFDRHRFAVITDQQRKIEIVDRDAGAVTSVHDFAEEGYIIRVRSITEIPGGAQWYVRTDRIKKLPDRYEFEPSNYLLYDVASKKVVRKLRRLPQILSRGARIAPDGSSWHVFDRDGNLQIVDPKTLKEIGKIDLSTPLFAGMPRLSLGRTDLLDGRDPKQYRMLCTLSDPVQHNRSSWGYVDIDLEHLRIGQLVEWGQGPSGWGTYVAKDAKIAVTMTGNFGGGGSDRRSRVQVYELSGGTKLREFSEEFRPRQMLTAVSPDGSKLYIAGAGSDFQVYDTTTLQKLKTVELDGEIYGQVFVLDG